MVQLPHRNRLSTSRPRRSVPRRCDPLGAANGPPPSSAVGEYGARIGPRMAMEGQHEDDHQPNLGSPQPAGLPQRHRPPRLRVTITNRSTAAACWLTALRCEGVDSEYPPRRQGSRRHKRRRSRDHLDDGDVAISDGHDERLTDSWVVEHIFHDHQAPGGGMRRSPPRRPELFGTMALGTACRTDAAPPGCLSGAPPSHDFCFYRVSTFPRAYHPRQESFRTTRLD